MKPLLAPNFQFLAWPIDVKLLCSNSILQNGHKALPDRPVQATPSSTVQR